MSSVDVTKLKLLIVEDNVHFRTLMRSILQALGICHLEESQDGIEALEVLKSQSPDLVIVDWKMEGMDGDEFVKQIRKLNGPNRFVPILMVTGYTETSLKTKAREAGVTDFLGKPISPHSLLSRIVGVMENPRVFYDTDDFFGPDRRQKTNKIEAKDRRKKQIEPVCDS
jgi:CheY-like chemotaxis protein